MREGPLAELFRATEAAQRQADPEQNDKAERLRVGEQPTVESSLSEDQTQVISALPAEEEPVTPPAAGEGAQIRLEAEAAPVPEPQAAGDAGPDPIHAPDAKPASA